MMKKYYREDDYEELFLESRENLQEQAPADVIVVKNDAEGLNRLKGELEGVINTMKQERPNE